MLKRGTQIIYVPCHANGDINHPACERGFVTSTKGNHAFCRFWLRVINPHELRTKSNSERVDNNMLVVKDSVSKFIVSAALSKYCRGNV